MKMTRWLLLLLTGFHSASGILERLRQNACMCLQRQTGPVDHGLSVILLKRNAKWKGGRDCDPGHTWPVGYSSGKKTYNGSSVNAASPGDRHSDLTAESVSLIYNGHICGEFEFIKISLLNLLCRAFENVDFMINKGMTMAWRNRHGACTVQTLFTKGPPYNRLSPCPTRQERQRLWSRVDSVIMDSSGSSSSVDPVLPFH
ncbi:hypothetical protein T09_2971 [Trichinella sp. T9]|nr:hypothetical protein T09_2971 [Trichinella sp. T9]